MYAYIPGAKLGFFPNGDLETCRQSVNTGMAGLQFYSLFKGTQSEGLESQFRHGPTERTPSRLISVIIPAHNEESYLPGTL